MSPGLPLSVRCLRRATQFTGSALMVFCALAAFAACAVAQPDLSASRAFVTGAGPTGVAVGDLNRDGRPDMVVTNFQGELGNSVSVLLGQRPGEFASRVDYTTGQAPFGVALGDVNGDNVLDIVTCNYSAATASVLLGAGNGTFGPKTDFAVGSGPNSIALADLDGDGRLDLLTAGYLSGVVTARMGDGAGGFPSRIDHATGAGPASVAVGDLNGDERLDVVTANFDAGTVSVLLGNGLGQMSPHVDHAVGALPNVIRLFDMDGDADLDIVTVDLGADAVTILRNNSTGGFNTRTDHSVGSAPTGLAVDDLDDDGSPDVVTANYGPTGAGSTVSVLMGTPGGGLGLRSDMAAGLGAFSVTLADANSDGALDLVVADQGSNRITIRNRAGSLGLAPRIDVNVFATGAAAIGDMNGDGRNDIALALQAGAIRCLRSDSTGNFRLLLTGNERVADSVSVQAADMNGDGKLDLVTSTFQGTVLPAVVVWSGDGAGRFNATSRTDLTFSPGPPEIRDINRDGKPDVVVPSRSDSSVNVLIAAPFAPFFLQPSLNVSLPGLGNRVALGDLNGDGQLDIVASSGPSGRISTFLGLIGASNAFAGLGARTDLAASYDGTWVGLHDVNRDGKLDLITTGNGARLALGNGDGTFAAPTVYPLGEVSTEAAFEDFDRDGIEDMVVLHSSGTSWLAALHRGDGVGGFILQNEEVFPAGPLPRLFVDDVTNDGRPDVTVVCYAVSAIGFAPSRMTTLLPLTPTADAPTTGDLTLSSKVTGPSTAYGSRAGQVVFRDRGTPAGTVTAFSDGVVGDLVIPQAGPRIGHLFTARYGGSAHYLPSRGQVTLPTTLSARLASVRDVPGDQGGQVSVTWKRSPLDGIALAPVTTYRLYRRIAPSANNWQLVGTVPATRAQSYTFVAPTVVDSVAPTTLRSVFKVEAEVGSTGDFWTSPPDSGHSIDNLAPLAPVAVIGAYDPVLDRTRLFWARDRVNPDFAQFQLFQGLTVDFVPDVSNRVYAGTDTNYIYNGPPSRFYKLIIVDRHGNKSPATLWTPGMLVGVEPGAAPLQLALSRPSPNPARVRSTLGFELPRDTRVRLGVYDVNGRLVRLLNDGPMKSGKHEVVWDLADAEGAHVRPGLFFARLETEERTIVRQFAVLQ